MLSLLNDDSSVPLETTIQNTEVEITDQEAHSKENAETLDTRSRTNEENQMVSMEMQIFDEEKEVKGLVMSKEDGETINTIDANDPYRDLHQTPQTGLFTNDHNETGNERALDSLQGRSSSSMLDKESLERVDK